MTTRPTTSFCLHPDVIRAVGEHAAAAGLSRSRWVEHILAAAAGVDHLTVGHTPEPAPVTERRWWWPRS